MAPNIRVWEREAEKDYDFYMQPTTPGYFEITPTRGTVSDLNENAIELTQSIAHKVGIPRWMMVAILIALFLIIVGIIFGIVRYCRKRHSRDRKKSMKSSKKTQNSRNLGKLQYKLEYDFYLKCLSVTIVHAAGLPLLNMNGTSNPYVKMYMLPNKKKEYKTKVHHNTLSPFFNDKFMFKNIPYADAVSKTIVFAVFNFNKFSKDDEIGEVKLPLCSVDLTQTILEWGELQNPDDDNCELISIDDCEQDETN